MGKRAIDHRLPNGVIADANAFTRQNRSPTSEPGFPDITTTIAGSANPENIKKWAKWIEEPIDRQLLAEVLEIFKPVKNIGHLEGLRENN